MTSPIEFFNSEEMFQLCKNCKKNRMLSPSIGRLEQAKRFALMDFDKWNDTAGFVNPHTSYYYEIQSCIEDAVEYGFGVAHGQTWKEIRKRIKNNQEIKGK